MLKIKGFSDASLLRGTIEAFEMELESNYKSEIYEIIKGMLERIDAQDRRLAQYCASKGLS